MKGKKIDSEFLSTFIDRCVQQDRLKAEEMVQTAKYEIEKIDQKSMETEKLKIRRSKLLDVITTFQKPGKSSKTEEVRIISFFQIPYPHICRFICNQLKECPRSKEQLVHHKFSIYDINICIKQLLEHKVITKTGKSFLRGDMFKDYLTFVLREG